MANPLVNRTVIVAAGAVGANLQVSGRYVRIVSCTAASVLLGFDAGTPERVYADDRLAGPTNGFESLRFIDDIGAGSTVVVQVTDEPIYGGAAIGVAPVLAAMAASLAAIDVDTDTLAAIAASLVAIDASLVSVDADLEYVKPGTVRTQFPRTVIGVAGAATAVFAANAARKKSQFQADINNAGAIWIGSAATVTQALSWWELPPGASSPVMEDTVAIWACSENGTEWLRAYEIA